MLYTQKASAFVPRPFIRTLPLDTTGGLPFPRPPYFSPPLTWNSGYAPVYFTSRYTQRATVCCCSSWDIRLTFWTHSNLRACRLSTPQDGKRFDIAAVCSSVSNMSPKDQRTDCPTSAPCKWLALLRRTETYTTYCWISKSSYYWYSFLIVSNFIRKVRTD